MGLKLTDALTSRIKVRPDLQKGKYLRRETVYVFLCSCGKELEVYKSDLNKVSGRCRECADRDTGKITSIRERKRPFEALYNKFVYDRKRINQTSDLTYTDFLEFTNTRHCHYCEDSVSWAEKSLSINGYAYNLDRMDNKKGYFKDNCVVCCWACNEIKGNRYTYREFMLLAPILKLIRAQRQGTCGS